MSGEIDTDELLSARLRELHAIKTRHFTSPEGVQAFSIVATADRLEDLRRAADMLQDQSDAVLLAFLDRAKAEQKLADANRQAATEFRKRLRSVLTSEAASRANDAAVAMALTAVADRMGVIL